MNRFLLGALIAALCQTSAQAVVTSGEIVVGEFGGDSASPALDFKVDRVRFRVTAGTTVNFDALVREENTDLNGDGELTFGDNQMSLFDSANTHLMYNDDGPFGADGSQSALDGNFDYLFTVTGTYFVTLGQLGYTNADAFAGYQPNAEFNPNKHFDWQLTLTPTDGTITEIVVTTLGNPHIPNPPVPEPTALSLLALALGISRRCRH